MNTHLPDASRLTPWDDIDLVSGRACFGSRRSRTLRLRLPAHERLRPGHETWSVWLRTLARDAAEQLGAAGVDDQVAADVLQPLKALEEDPSFWQHQGLGLALFTAPGFAGRLRLPVAPDEQVAVGAVFRLRPLIPLLAPSIGFLVLALA